MTEPRRAPLRRRLVRGLLVVLALIVLVSVGGALWLNGRLRASLPVLEGDRRLPGLMRPVSIERDELGVPWIRGADRTDVARALGFLHGQERFFQMDLLRRGAAGELSELIGAAGLGQDRAARVHRFRALAREVLGNLTPVERTMLDVYAEGVDAGVAALGAKPPEYLALRVDPAPWAAEDSLLTVYAMYFVLQGGSGRFESMHGLAHDLLPPELYTFLSADGDEWDAPLVGGPLEVPPIPGPDVIDLRNGAALEPSGEAARSLPGSRSPGSPRTATFPVFAALAGPRDLPDELAGSNNWAVAGRLTADGAALLANDMHLGLGLPNTWYRASLEWDDATTGLRQRITGVTLPGTPSMVVGSNGQIAWGYTNSQGDWYDLVVLEIDPDDPARYRTPDGWRAFDTHQETIRVHGGTDDVYEVRWTIWGPVVDRDHLDRPRALRWLAHDTDFASLGLLDMEVAREIVQAMEIANRSLIPTQNFTVADQAGRVGWTLRGPMPQRFGFDGRLPASWADGTRGWHGRLAPEAYPRVLDPEDGLIWTANNRVVGGAMLEKIGYGGFAGGARAGQIRDDLRALHGATPEKLLEIQLDDRAVFLERWRDLLLATLDDDAVRDRPRRDEMARVVREGWTGRASIDSAGYRLVRGWRGFVQDLVFEPLAAPCLAADEGFDVRWILTGEGPLWNLLQERPLHLLDPKYEDWDALLLAAVDRTTDFFLQDDDPSLATKTWGLRNRVQLQHPLSRAVPALSRWLDSEVVQLPGDSNMPRVQSTGFGASERMVVSVGHEERSLFHMPGGQSGHFLSPFYLAGNEDWIGGHPTRFLPGPARYRLTLNP